MEQKKINAIRAFNRFYTTFIGLLDRHLLDSPFSLPEARVLYELHRREGLVAGDIVSALKMDKSYLSRMLDQFNRKKLITRSRSVTDARAVVIFLTAKGKKEAEALSRASDKQIAGILAGLPEGQTEQLVYHMNEIQKILSAPAIDPKTITIRTELRPGDLGYLIYLHGHLYGDEYQYGISFETYVAQGVHEFYQQYDPQKDRVWICEDGDKIVGFLLSMHREKNTAQLRYFILEPDYRGIGLGKRLMALYMDHLRDKGYQHSYLWTTSELETAAALYIKHGFRLTEEKRSDAFGKPLYEQRYDLNAGTA